jgi:hypothetical protein
MRALGYTLLAGSAFFAACTLITDVDREKIPEPPDPTFPQIDAGDDAGGDDDGELPDATVDEPDAAGPEAGSSDAGDSGSDAAPDAGDGG